MDESTLWLNVADEMFSNLKPIHIHNGQFDFYKKIRLSKTYVKYDSQNPTPQPMQGMCNKNLIDAATYFINANLITPSSTEIHYINTQFHFTASGIEVFKLKSYRKYLKRQKGIRRLVYYKLKMNRSDWISLGALITSIIALIKK